MSRSRETKKKKKKKKKKNPETNLLNKSFRLFIRNSFLDKNLNNSISVHISFFFLVFFQKPLRNRIVVAVRRKKKSWFVKERFIETNHS